MPPPTSTLKPTSPSSFFRSCSPMSCQAIAARSSVAPVTAILNLRGRNANSGCKRAPLPQQFAIRARVDDLVGCNASQRVAGDVADAVAAGLDAMHVHGRERVHHVGSLRQRDPVVLQVLARRDVNVAAVVGAGDIGQCAQLPGAQFAVGHRHAQHRRMALHVPAVLQPQRAETHPRAVCPRDGARAGRGTAQRAGGRTACRNRCMRTCQTAAIGPASASATHARVRTSRRDIARVCWASSQMAGMDPIGGEGLRRSAIQSGCNPTACHGCRDVTAAALSGNGVIGGPPPTPARPTPAPMLELLTIAIPSIPFEAPLRHHVSAEARKCTDRSDIEEEHYQVLLILGAHKKPTPRARSAAFIPKKKKAPQRAPSSSGIAAQARAARNFSANSCRATMPLCSAFWHQACRSATS